MIIGPKYREKRLNHGGPPVAVPFLPVVIFLGNLSGRKSHLSLGTLHL